MPYYRWVSELVNTKQPMVFFGMCQESSLLVGFTNEAPKIFVFGTYFQSTIGGGEEGLGGRLLMKGETTIKSVLFGL